jgi:hypothetical protein
MTRSKKYSLTAVLSLGILAACGGGGGVTGDAAAQLGQAFAQAFRASDTAEPVEPGTITYQNVPDSNVAALATLEPVDF